MFRGRVLQPEPLVLRKGNAHQSAEEAQVEFLVEECGFSRKMATDIVRHGAPGSDHSPTIWHMVNQMTSFAQTMEFQEDRVELELRAGALLDAAVR